MLFNGLLRNRSKNPRDNSPLKPVILITGCSSGIGLSLARLLWKEQQYQVIITARPTSLRKFKSELFVENERFWIRPLDVTDQASIEKLFSEIENKWGGVDILVNNAGICYRSAVEDMSPDEEFHQISTNYMGPMALIRQCLPYMRKNKQGQIINVSSVGGMMGMTTMASYSASKFALEGATEALWYELKPWNIKVSLIQPGFVNSDGYKHVIKSQQSILQKIRSPYRKHYNNMEKLVEKMMKLSPATASTISKSILKTIQSSNPKLRVRVTPDAHIFALLRRLLPRKTYHYLFYYSLPGILSWGKEFLPRQKQTQTFRRYTRTQKLPPIGTHNLIQIENKAPVFTENNWNQPVFQDKL